MGIRSRIKKGWKNIEKREIKDLVRNVDKDAYVEYRENKIIVVASIEEKYWKILKMLERFGIEYNTNIKHNIGYRIYTINIYPSHKHLESDDVFGNNSLGGLEL